MNGDKDKRHKYEEETKRRSKMRSKQVTPLCDMMAQFRWGREGGLTSNSLKGINVRATGGQRITKWSLTAALRS